MCVYGLFVQSMQLHTHQIYRNMEHSWNIATSVCVLTSYINTVVLTSKRHKQRLVTSCLKRIIYTSLKLISLLFEKIISSNFL